MLDLQSDTVTFRCKDYAHESQTRSMTLSSEEFLRRFCLHILPLRFVKIRHWGILSNRDGPARITQARALLVWRQGGIDASIQRSFRIEAAGANVSTCLTVALISCITKTRMQRIEVSAGLVFREGTLLITQRRPQDHLGGLWEFPGGKREPGESFEACLHRELKEELGIEVEVGAVVEEISHDYPEKPVHLKFFHCLWLRHEPQAIGCHAFTWVTGPQLTDYAFPAADTRLLEKLKSTTDWWR